MRRNFTDRLALIDRLRLGLPLSARARKRLVERLSAFLPPEAARSSLLVTDVYDAGEELGLLCQLDLTRYRARVSYLVVPVDHLAFDRTYGLGLKPHRHRRCPKALRAS